MSMRFGFTISNLSRLGGKTDIGSGLVFGYIKYYLSFQPLTSYQKPNLINSLLPHG
jgi:hypothetical protein